MPENSVKMTLLRATLLFFTLNLWAQGTVETSLELNSDILALNERYSIYLPTNYTAKNTYPVIFLMHGFGGSENSWIKRANIKATIDSLTACKSLPEIIAVFPNGRNSYFMNDIAGNYKFEDYFIHELFPAIDSIYSVSSNKNKRAIGGLSMGGFGAVLISVKHPELFGSVYNISGAVRTKNDFINLTPVKYHKNFASIYGSNLMGEERITAHWIANSPYSLIDSSNAVQLSSINWYIDCGKDDFLFSANESLHQLLVKHNIPHDYISRDGGHSWEYWSTSIVYALECWGKHLEEMDDEE